MKDETPQIRELHGLYCQLVGCTLTLTMDRLYWWTAWQAHGWKADDLRLVVRHILKGIKEGHRHFGALKFTNLVADATRFEEELCECQAEARNLKPSPSHKEQFIHARIPITGPMSEKCSAVPIAQVLEAMRNAVNHPTP